jgi:hypothetical protein
MTKKTTRTKKSTKKKGKKKMDMKDLTKLKQDYEKALREKGQEIMKSAVEAFFAANPKINGVAWTQYTPYFNDGDECHFGVHGPSFAVGEINKKRASLLRGRRYTRLVQSRTPKVRHEVALQRRTRLGRQAQRSCGCGVGCVSRSEHGAPEGRQ